VNVVDTLNVRTAFQLQEKRMWRAMLRKYVGMNHTCKHHKIFFHDSESVANYDCECEETGAIDTQRYFCKLSMKVLPIVIL
jgi:hypothetical protein